MHLINRREFTASMLACATGGSVIAEQPKPSLDLHVHLFGTGDSGSGCRLSDGIQNGIQFRALTVALGVHSKGKTLDEGYAAVLEEHAKTSGLKKIAILGQDAVYDSKGEPDWKRTSFYVPNDYVFKVAQQYRELMIPCPSINPLRKDAIEEVERIREKGARLFKIHPPTQGVDVADRRHIKFYRRCAELKIVVMVHTGHEHSAPVIDKDFANPTRLELMLDQGPTVVACHAGTGWPSDVPDQLPAFLNLLKRYPKLWGDTAVLGTSGRVRDFCRLLDTPMVKERLLHGSDFPFPVSPTAFGDRISKEMILKILNEKSWIAKDFQLKNALGAGKANSEKAWEVVMGAT